MKFNHFIKALEIQLGYHHVPVNPLATAITNIFDSSPVHTDLMVKIVRAIYKKNRCNKLTDTITRQLTNEALLPIHQQVIHSKTTDIDKYNFITDLCQAVERIFADASRPSPGKTTTSNKNKTASVVTLDNYRFRRLRSSV